MQYQYNPSTMLHRWDDILVLMYSVLYEKSIIKKIFCPPNIIKHVSDIIDHHSGVVFCACTSLPVNTTPFVVSMCSNGAEFCSIYKLRGSPL